MSLQQSVGWNEKTRSLASTVGKKSGLTFLVFQVSNDLARY